MARTSPASKAYRILREAALGYPEAAEDSPWGDPVMKVRGKIFLFLSVDADGLSVTAKLPQTSGIALMLPNVEPTGYNLGRSGWVSGTFETQSEPPMKMLRAWIDESYRSVAPKKLLARLDGAPAPKAAAKAPVRARKVKR
ncbi:MAG TPA: MmcQ/YjbR family DNA-binding protein [Myxococcales bacterium]